MPSTVSPWSSGRRRMTIARGSPTALAQPPEPQRGARPPALEPVDERDVDREEAAHARAERDDDERRVELEQRVDERKRDEAQAEQHYAEADQALRAEAVHD